MLQGLRRPTLESHDAIELVKLVSDDTDRQVYDSRAARALKYLIKHCDYPTRHKLIERAYNPFDHPENLSLRYLFAIFNDLFFLGILPSRTTVSRSPKATDSAYRNLHRFATPIIATAIEIPVRTSGRIDVYRTVNIVVPFVNSFKNQVTGLLGAMIDLYIRYNSCANPSCLEDIVIRGKMGRGQAWQIIAYKLEASDTMRSVRKEMGMEVDLRRMDELEWELSHWNLTELELLKQWIYRHSSDRWTRELKFQLPCLKVAQDRISDEAVARDEGRRAGNEFTRSRFGEVRSRSGRMISLFGRKLRRR
ncbi:hypothetical protein EAE96_007448 [Botrytis aclada]|nr:hypothetical protein EAE96_007448 [Botrytis aclada]